MKNVFFLSNVPLFSEALLCLNKVFPVLLELIKHLYELAIKLFTLFSNYFNNVLHLMCTSARFIVVLHDMSVRKCCF